LYREISREEDLSIQPDDSISTQLLVIVITQCATLGRIRRIVNRVLTWAANVGVSADQNTFPRQCEAGF
jgi:hypothetical protein